MSSFPPHVPPHVTPLVPPVAPRPAFVTAVAWIFIVLAGFAVIISFFQVLMVVVMFSDAEISAAVAREANAPAIAIWLFSHLRMIILAFFVLNIGTLVSAIGMLRRSEWARKVFILMLVVGIAWLLGGMLLQYQIMSSMSKLPATGGASVDMQFSFMMKAMGIAWALIAIVFSALFGWIIARLSSTVIQNEFRA